jgi:hypothetical protein
MLEEYAPAKTTNRSAWGWSFLGLFFAPFTGVALLIKNSHLAQQTG